MSEANASAADGKAVHEWPGRNGRPLMRVILISLAVFLLIYLLSGIRLIRPEELALVARFGKLRPVPLTPGTHYCLPAPIDRVTRIRPNEVKSVTVGARAIVTPPEEGEAVLEYESEETSELLTGDENIIHITLNMQYKVGEPAAYVFNTQSPERLVKLAAEVALTDVVSRTPVDDLLTSGKQWVLAQVKEKTQSYLEQYGAGAMVISATFAGVAPPIEVDDAFKDVASALEDRDRRINEATGEYNAAIPRARGEAMQQVEEATAAKNARINRAQGDADRFLATLHEFRQAGNKETSLLRLYMETMEDVMPRLKKYIVQTHSGLSRAAQEGGASAGGGQ